MKIKLATLVLTATAIGCQSEDDSLDQFRSTKLGVSLEETDTSLALSGSGQNNEVTVKIRRAMV